MFFSNILIKYFEIIRILLYRNIKIPYLNLEKKIIDITTFYLNKKLYDKKVLDYIKSEKINFENLPILKKSNLKILNYGDLVDIIKIKSNEVSTCHIIASGSSVLDSYKKINKNDIVIGFNFSALLDIKFDLYFVEIGTEDQQLLSIVSDVQHHLLKTNMTKIKKVIYKNIWEKKIDISYISRKYSCPIIAVKDIYLNTTWSEYDFLDAKIIVKNLLSLDEEYMKQSFTTTLTCLILAIHCSFKEVIIHGWDFFGPHFYCSDDFEWPSGLPQSNIEYLKKVSNNSNIHLTFEKKLLIVLKQLKNKSKTLKINIYSASNKSYLSNIFPVYKFEKK